MRILVDADFLVALAKGDDSNHKNEYARALPEIKIISRIIYLWLYKCSH